MKLEPKRCTARGNLVRDTNTGAPTEEKLRDGQLADHFVLCPEDRAKGYVEPYRESYVHVGPPGPEFELQDLTDEQCANYSDCGYVKFEPYPEHMRPATGRFWTQEQLDKIGKGCGAVTTMPRACAETYAAQPSYYGSTFCCHCGDYFPVGKDGEFVWDKSSMQRVGTHRETKS
jgi:hypothetical protein